MDEDLESKTHAELLVETRRLRAAIRSHRDSSGHELCWHHPALWSLLPDPMTQTIAVPPWPKFLRGCVAYRESLAEQLPQAPVLDEEADRPASAQQNVAAKSYP